MTVKGLTTPKSLVALSYCFCVGTRDSSVASYWIDTLVLKNWGKYLRYFAASSSPLSGNPTQCSRGSKKNFWRHCRGVCAKVNIPSTHHNHYLPHYITCHLPLVFLSPTSPLSFYSPHFRSIFCLLVLPCTFFLLASSFAKSLWILIHLLISLRDQLWWTYC